MDGGLLSLPLYHPDRTYITLHLARGCLPIVLLCAYLELSNYILENQKAINMQGLLFTVTSLLALASATPFLDHRNTCKADNCARYERSSLSCGQAFNHVQSHHWNHRRTTPCGSTV